MRALSVSGMLPCVQGESILSFERENHPPGHQPAGQCLIDSYMRLLPSTCSVASMRARNGCSYQIPLDDLVGTPDLNFQVALDTCPGTLLPFISMRIGGEGATNLIAPCSTDNDCGASHKCFDLPRSILGTRSNSICFKADLTHLRCVLNLQVETQLCMGSKTKHTTIIFQNGLQWQPSC